jgi:hypothetical protein
LSFTLVDAVIAAVSITLQANRILNRRNDSCRNQRASCGVRRGTLVAGGRCATGEAEYEWGEALVRVGVRSIPLGIAAVVLGFVLKSPGKEADPIDFGWRAEHRSISVFGTIHPNIFRFQAPIGSQPDHVGVVSLGPHLGSDAGTNEHDILADMPWQNASFDERFALFQVGSSDAGANEQDILADTPVSAWWNASFDERFPGLATRELTGDVDPIPLPDDDGRTAIYDIAAHAVYLPDGRRLEAHSGLGGLKDNPRHVHVKMRGATPPNVYNLSLRERLFHGVRAIRLTPVDSGRMYGRDGMLAHSYMHGSNGQSNGCVAFGNYPEFLNAFLKGEVTRLVVVERLENPPGPKAASGSLPDAVRSLFNPSDRVGQYAAADAF